MLLHGLTVIASRHQRDRRPERAHPRQVRLPIADPRREHGTDQGILPDAAVEAADQPLDHRFVDPGLAPDGVGDLRTPLHRRCHRDGHGRASIASGIRQQPPHAAHRTRICDQIGQRISVEHREKGAQGLVEHPAQPAGRRYHTGVTLAVEALDQCETVLGGAHDRAQIDGGGRTLEPQPAAAAARRADEAGLHQRLRHLHQMVAGNSVDAAPPLRWCDDDPAPSPAASSGAGHNRCEASGASTHPYRKDGRSPMPSGPEQRTRVGCHRT